jgi:threonine/homoserine/homoserine lactone efflux protein
MPVSALLADIQQLALFVLAGVLLNLTPGVDMALVLRSSAALGFRAGAAAALGVSAGCWVHIVAAALGVSGLLAGSPTAFAVLQWLGATYLVWLGIGLLRQRRAAPGSAPAADGTRALRRLFAQGFLTNALNPKVALFFLAFVPQFIRPAPAHPALAFVLLGGVFVVNGTLVNLAIAAAAAALRSSLAGQPRWQRLGAWLNRGVGVLFLVLGLKLALGGPGR